VTVDSVLACVVVAFTCGAMVALSGGWLRAKMSTIWLLTAVVLGALSTTMAQRCWHGAAVLAAAAYALLACVSLSMSLSIWRKKTGIKAVLIPESAVLSSIASVDFDEATRKEVTEIAAACLNFEAAQKAVSDHLREQARCGNKAASEIKDFAAAAKSIVCQCAMDHGLGPKEPPQG
jgi:hypothetical protein